MAADLVFLFVAAADLVFLFVAAAGLVFLFVATAGLVLLFVAAAGLVLLFQDLFRKAEMNSLCGLLSPDCYLLTVIS